MASYIEADASPDATVSLQCFNFISAIETFVVAEFVSF